MRYTIIRLHHGRGPLARTLYSFRVEELSSINDRHIRAARMGESAIIDTWKGVELSKKTGGRWGETPRSRMLKTTGGSINEVNLETHCDAACAGV